MKRRGYTLFEMVIVVALILLLAGLAIPSIESMYSEYRLQAAVDEVRSKWAAIRARAITEGRPYRFAITPGGADFRVAPDASDFWSGGDAPASAETGSPPLVAQDSLPTGIRFGTDDSTAGSAAGSSAAGSWSTKAVFLPDGTAQQDEALTFGGSGSGAIVLRLRALTGGISSRWLPANGSR